MSDATASLEGDGEKSVSRRLRSWGAAAAAGLALSYPVYLALMLRAHAWILGAHGRPLITDFLVFQASGTAALSGHATAAYDLHSHHLAVAAAAGREFGRSLPFDYPPLFLFVTAALALLPYLPAFLVWLGTTTALYAAAIGTIAKSRLAALVACAAPAVFINAISGQNGCLTAALIGAILLNLETDTLVGGVLLGLLICKPQLGILFPFVLAATGRWRTLGIAALTAFLGLALSSLVFGIDTIPAFLSNMSQASHQSLTDGANGWNNLETLYGLARLLGLGNAAAWILQAGLALTAAGAIVWLWKRPVPWSLKAAALSTASLLASPYLHIYDLVILAVPLAFLAGDCALDLPEILALILANGCVGAYLFLPTPVGLAAILIVAGLIARRAMLSEPSALRTGIALAHGAQGYHP